MIQRIQSVLILLAVICYLMLFVSPVFTWNQAAVSHDSYRLSVMELELVRAGESTRVLINWPTVLMNTFLIGMSVVVIFMYKNRKKQARMCHLLLILHLALISLILYNWDLTAQLAGTSYTWGSQYGLLLLVLPVPLLLAARHYILKDEALVRSADRLR